MSSSLGQRRCERKRSRKYSQTRSMAFSSGEYGEFPGAVPAGAVHEHDGMGAGGDRLAEFIQHRLHPRSAAAMVGRQPDRIADPGTTMWSFLSRALRLVHRHKHKSPIGRADVVPWRHAHGDQDRGCRR